MKTDRNLLIAALAAALIFALGGCTSRRPPPEPAVGPPMELDREDLKEVFMTPMDELDFDHERKLLLARRGPCCAGP